MSVSPMNLYVRLSIGPVRQEDVDALLHAMDAPLRKGETRQARAEALQRLANDPVVGELRGRDGRQLAMTAAQALRSVDTLDDEVLPERVVKPREKPLSSASSFQFSSGVLGLLWGLYELCVALIPMLQGESGAELGTPFLLVTPLTMLLPSYLLLQQDSSISRTLRVVVGVLILLAVPFGLVCSFLYVMVGGSGRRPHIGDLAGLFAQGAAVRLLLLIPFSKVLGRSKSQKQGTSG